MPVPIRFTVVSWPATNSSETWSRSSTDDSRSPSSSAAISAVSRSSAGWSRFHAMTSSISASIDLPAATAARISSSVMIGSSVLTSAPDHSATWSLSASGMPSISEITSNGSGNASSPITSAEPALSIASSAGRPAPAPVAAAPRPRPA